MKTKKDIKEAFVQLRMEVEEVRGYPFTDEEIEQATERVYERMMKRGIVSRQETEPDRLTDDLSTFVVESDWFDFC